MVDTVDGIYIMGVAIMAFCCHQGNHSLASESVEVVPLRMHIAECRGDEDTGGLYSCGFCWVVQGLTSFSRDALSIASPTQKTRERLFVEMQLELLLCRKISLFP